MVMYFFKLRMTLEALAIVQIVATVLSSYVAYLYVKDLAKVFSRVDWKLFRELFHFGKYTFGTNISSMVMKSTDTWLIGRLITPTAVAIYNPALRLSNLVEVPTLTITNIVFPAVPQKMKERGKEGVRDIYIKSVSLILAAMAPMVIPLFVLAEPIIRIIFGEEYIEAASILRITIFYSLIIPFNRQFGMVMDGLKSPKLNFYLLLITAVLNAVLNYFFLIRFGLIGSAWATLVSYIFIFALNQYILYRMFDINTFKVFEAMVDWYKVGWDIFRKKIVKLA
jgi:O-antigen/teichoic acid export membrane protein